ncbi:hypothetical protein GIB67_015988 [Kingdonia uniflora]|uniref:Uncharacterized protein n=1 Tax=Kingdonia uniflora TaxID=39325 RepID=A0A7J7ML15_9MAGN|nr:hypothetical protein GIB67_015988 [Kingdonia uniflora]
MGPCHWVVWLDSVGPIMEKANAGSQRPKFVRKEVSQANVSLPVRKDVEVGGPVEIESYAPIISTDGSTVVMTSEDFVTSKNATTKDLAVLVADCWLENHKRGVSLEDGPTEVLDVDASMKALLMEDACKEVKVDASKEVPVLVDACEVVVDASKEVVVDTYKESAIQNISTGTCKGLSVHGSKVYDVIKEPYLLIIAVLLYAEMGDFEAPFKGITKDVNGRKTCYKQDWTTGIYSGFRWVEMMAPIFSREAWHLNNVWKLTTPEEVLSIFLVYLRVMAELQLKRDVRNFVLTIPVLFSQFRLTRIERACAMAGLFILRLMPEQTVMALLYGQHQQQMVHDNMGNGSENIAMIFNMGVGYCDLCVTATTGGVSQIKSLSGSHIGGEDIVQNIMHHLFPNMDSLFLSHKNNEMKAMGLLRVAAQDAVIMLSSQDIVMIDVDLENGLRICKVLGQPKFEEVNRKVFEKCESLVE